MDNLGTKTQREGLIDNVAMNSQAKFEKMGIKNFVGGPKYTYRDIFGFENPAKLVDFYMHLLKEIMYLELTLVKTFSFMEN